MPKLTKEEVINRTLSKYVSQNVDYTPPTVEEILEYKLQNVQEGHALTLVSLFYTLNETNQIRMLETLDTFEGVNNLLDFAINEGL